MIAKIDADAPNGKASAQEHGVTGFPTLKWFPKGSTPKEAIPYESARSEEALTNFINQHAGTHRAVGGGVTESAGRIDVLDVIAQKIVAGKKGAEKELAKAVKEAEGKYAKYYAKVAEKLAKNKEYVEKEIKRLAGIAAKGGLAPEKYVSFLTSSSYWVVGALLTTRNSRLDDILSRKNILSQFVLVDDTRVADEL